jgi:ankyrin repeat protein
MVASSAGKIDVVQKLLNHDAKVSAKNVNGCLALHYAASKCSKIIVELLRCFHSNPIPYSSHLKKNRS